MRYTVINEERVMLAIQKKRRFTTTRTVVICLSLLAMGAGGYLFSLSLSPAIASVITTRPIAVRDLNTPKDNRIVIPRLGVNIPYGEGEAALDRGAQWRFPDRGNPASGGNFIIAAHRFSIQPTPKSTIEKSPFYAIDKLEIGDKVIVDYSGKRYAYQIDRKFTVKPDQTEIEAPSDDAKLTLYSCSLGGAADGRVVLVSHRLGEVAVDQP